MDMNLEHFNALEEISDFGSFNCNVSNPRINWQRINYMIKVLITGGAGFIGSNFVRYMLERHSDYQIVVLDKLTYAGNLLNLKDLLDEPRLTVVRLDLCDPGVAEVVSGCELVVHLAAESHVDRSIHDAAVFVRTNVEGTLNLVECCRRANVKRYVQVSTDEVYGSLGPKGKFTETSPIDPSSPYSASKAAADMLVQSYFKTHRFPAMITRCSNNYGPYQFPEKFIPLMISQALANQNLPVYGDGKNVRNWIHVMDHCVALDLILHRGREGQVYNIGGSVGVRESRASAPHSGAHQPASESDQICHRPARSRPQVCD